MPRLLGKPFLDRRPDRPYWTLAAIMGLAMGGWVILVPPAPAQTAGGAPPAVPVGVVTVKPQPVRLWSSFSGRLHAVDFAEIRPQVGGLITQIRFKDGQTVKANDILVVIDPRPYEAAVAKAEANLASAKANAEFAKTEYERAQTMIKTGAIAQRVFDERANTYRVTQAAIGVASAELAQARIDLDHAYVKAPIGGRISRAEITVGNFVQSSPPPLLTSIVSNDGIYADFEVDEQTYLKSIRAQASTRDKEQHIPVELRVSSDPDHIYSGTIFSFDNRIDTATGTIRARAKFANEDSSLVPGMFVSVKLAGGSDTTALIVPERAISSDQNKKFVLLVNADSKVVYREVTLGGQVDNQRVITQGIIAGDRVIIDGIQHVRPDVVVAPTESVTQLPHSPGVSAVR